MTTGSMHPTHSRSSNISPLPFVWVTRGSSLQFYPQSGHRPERQTPLPFLGATAAWPRAHAGEGPSPTVGSSCPLVARDGADSLVSRPGQQPRSFWPGAPLDLGRSLELGQPLLNALPQWLDPEQGQGSFLIPQLIPAQKSTDPQTTSCSWFKSEWGRESKR